MALPLRAVEVPGLLMTWGTTNLITTNSIATIGPITRVAAGGFHALALRPDGTVTAWGDNTYGQTNLPAGLSNVVAIAAGSQHSLAVRSNGTVLAWGRNTSQQTNVPAALTGVMAVAAGADHSVALRSNGTVVAWGVSLTLTNVPASATNVTAISAGPYVTLALRGDGSVVAWGNGVVGSVTNVPATATNVIAISAGQNHCLALRADGSLVAWGDNTFNQTVIPTAATNIVKISAGWLYSLVQRADGQLIGFGLATSGQTTPPASLTNYSSFAAGNNSGLAVNLAPRILTAPASPITLAAGQSTNLQATVLSGSTFGLQWYFNGGVISEATNTSLAVSNFNVTKAGIYSLTVTNAAASASISTILRLSNAPTIQVNGVLIGGGAVARTNFGTVTITATTNAYPKLYYTLDGTEPDFTSPVYSGVLTLSNSTTIRAVAYNNLITDKAEAAPVSLQVIPTYPLVIAGGGGTITRSPAADLGTNSYLSNTLVTLTATPSSGWEFLYWQGAASGANPETTVPMTQSNFVRAVFGTTLNLNTNYPLGAVVTDPPFSLFPYGTTVTLTAWPQSGAYFFGWAGLFSSFANPVTIVATNSSGLTALFAPLKPEQVSLMVIPVNGGTIQFSPAQNVYTNGDTVTLTALPTTNRVFSFWSNDASGTNNPLTITLDSNRLIYANYIPGIPYSYLPSFTTPPTGRSLSPGDNTSLNTFATGVGVIGYQWRFNSTNLSGATNIVLNLTNVTTARAGFYDVLATNAYGGVTSPKAPVALFGLQLVSGVGNERLPLLVVDCAPGAAFSLQMATSLIGSNWTEITPWTLNAARGYFVDAAVTNQPQRFYRLVPQ
jgi:hypothetical protein